MKYASKNGSDWHNDIVHSGGRIGEYSSLALDSSNNAHISYFGASEGLQYVSWNGAEWTPVVEADRTLDGGNWRGEWTTLVLDSNEDPHICYQGAFPRDLYYTYWDGTDWQQETVVGDVPHEVYYSSMALDDSDTPHFSYYKWSTHEIMYWDGVSPEFVAVDTTPGEGLGTSLRLDGSGNPHITYLDRDASTLYYAYLSGSSWETETVPTAANDLHSFVLDEHGNAHIAFSTPEKDLKYAFWNGSWSPVDTVDSAGDVGNYSSLAVDANGRVHISYYDETNEHLKYALGAPVPEPTSCALLALAIGGIGLTLRRRRKQ